MVKLDKNLLQKIQEIEGVKYSEITWVNDVIYGLGGFNRYFLNSVINGEKKIEEFEPDEILFSEFHSSKEFVKKAVNAGFRIFR